MRNGPLPLIGQFYSDDARPWSMQDVCNYLPAAAETEGTRTATKCTTPPGLSPFVETGSLSAVRGLYNANGRLFGVIGPTFYEFSAEGVAIPRGTVGGASRVRMAHNQLTHGNEVVVVNGSSGYLYNTQTQIFAAISDDGYPGAIDVVFIDGYFVQIEPARRFAFNSDLASGADYNTLDRFTSEVSPDPLVGLAAPQNELILFSETSAEFFANEGTAQQPFRSKRISMKRGAASRYGQAELDNTVFWLGNDGKFYVLDGYSPKRISTRPIEQAIRGLNWAQAFAFVWESEGHAVVYWTFPDGRTWGYDASQGRWHRRASYGLDRWRVSATAYWEGRWIAGDFQRGRLWELDWGYPWEYQTEFVSEIVAPVVHDNQNRVLMPRLEVLMDVGQPEVAVREFGVQPTGPTITGAAPDGTVGVVYGPYSYTGTPGDAPISVFSITAGALPEGLSLSGAGTITGTPEVSGEVTITVRVTDTNGLYDEMEDTLSIAAATWLLAKTGGSGTVPLKVSPDGDDWTAAFADVPLTGGTSWGPTGIGSISSRSGRVLAVSATAGGGSDDAAYHGDDDIWRKATLNAGTGSMQTLWSSTHWWVAKHSAGSCEVSADGITFTAIGVVAHTIARVGAFVLTAYASGAALGRVEFTLRDADGAASGTTIPDFDGAYVRGDARMASDGGDNVCMAVRGGSVTPFTSHILESTDGGLTWADLGTPFPTFVTSPDGANRHVHYGLGRWFVFEQTRVAIGTTIAGIALDPFVFPQNVRGVADDGTKLICCGEGGMLYKWTVADGWEALDSGTTDTLMDVCPVSEWP